jgi:hypothetical protein
MGVVIEQPRLVDSEHDNLRAALRWACAHDPDTALRLVASLWRFWFIRVTRSRERGGPSEPWRYHPARPGRGQPP